MLPLSLLLPGANTGSAGAATAATASSGFSAGTLLAAGSLGLGIAGVGLQLFGSYQANREARRRYAEAAAAARENFVRQIATVRAQQDQYRAQLGAQADSIGKQATQAKSRVQTAAGESNIGGTSVQDLIRDYEFQKSERNAILQQNYADAEAQSYLQLEGVRSGSQSQVNSAYSPNTFGLSAASSVLALGQLGLNYYDRQSYFNQTGPYRKQ